MVITYVLCVSKFAVIVICKYSSNWTQFQKCVQFTQAEKLKRTSFIKLYQGWQYTTLHKLIHTIYCTLVLPKFFFHFLKSWCGLCFWSPDPLIDRIY